MKAWIGTDTDGRIVCSTTEKQFSEEMTEVELPDEFDFTYQDDYIYKDGELVYDGKMSSEAEKALKVAERNAKYSKQLLTASKLFVQTNSASLTDAQAREVSLLFKEWTIGETYTKGEIVQYQDEIYRCGQPSIVASDVYKPGDTGTEAIYSKIEITETGYEVWKEWDGVSGIYAQDQIVQDPEDGLLYKSKTPNNVWGPPHEQPDHWELYSETA